MNGHRTRVLGLTLLSLTLAVALPAAEPDSASACATAEELGFSDPSPRTDTATVTAIERVSRGRVSKAQARRISMLNPVLSLVSISGRTIQVLPGASMWSLSNGSFAIFDSEPTVSAMQVWTKDMGDGDLYVRACLCPGSNPNVDDGCKFDNPSHPTNPGNCSGNTCCGIIDGLIEGDGTVHRF
jgi:hypothetical protein